MDSSQTVAVGLKLTTLPTATPTPVSTATPRPTPKGSVFSNYEKGEGYYFEGKYQLAVNELNTAIRLNPNGGDAYFDRGMAYRKLGQYQRAIEDFDKAIQLDPGYANGFGIYTERGYAYVELGQYQRAIQDFDMPIRLDPGWQYGYSNRGRSYGSLGQYQRAIQDFDKVIQQNPGLGEERINTRNKAYTFRSLAYLALGQHTKACSLDSKYCRRLRPKNLAIFSPEKCPNF